MDPVVTARVPADIRARGTEVLREIGANTSDLINAAFAYVIEHKELPKAKVGSRIESGNRHLDAAQAEELGSFMNAVRVPVPSALATTQFESLLDEAMEERYAHLR